MRIRFSSHPVANFCAREFTAEANGDQKLKAIWWLAALMGQDNSYLGEVFEYQPLVGTGAALVGLTPTDRPAAGLEFDEEDVEVYAGDRNVLSGGGAPTPAARGHSSTGGEKRASVRAISVTGPYFATLSRMAAASPMIANTRSSDRG